MKSLYTAEALVTGEGREGHARSSDGLLDVKLALPAGLGGSGAGTNPEQLFAAGYAACFHSSLLAIGRQDKLNVTDSAVGARVGIGALTGGAFGLEVAIEASLPHLSHSVATSLTEKAHQMCPYSNAIRGNVEVTLTVVDDAE